MKKLLSSILLFSLLLLMVVCNSCQTNKPRFIPSHFSMEEPEPISNMVAPIIEQKVFTDQSINCVENTLPFVLPVRPLMSADQERMVYKTNSFTTTLNIVFKAIILVLFLLAFGLILFSKT